MKLAFMTERVGSELRRRWRPVACLAVGFAVAALALGAYRLTVLTARQTASGLRRGAHVIAYLRDELPAERVELLRRTLESLPGVQQATLVSSEQAMSRLQHEMAAANENELGDIGDLFGGLEEGFLPRSIEVSLSPSPAIADQAQRLAVRLRALDGVADADVAVAHLERLMSWSALGRWSAFGLLGFAFLAALGAVTVGVWAVRGGRRDEARVLAFLGMSPIEAMLPVVVACVLAAVLGCAAGVGTLFVLWRGLVAGVLSHFRDALGPLLGAAAFLPAREWLIGLAGAVLLGVGIGMLAARFRERHASW